MGQATNTVAFVDGMIISLRQDHYALILREKISVTSTNMQQL